MTDDPVIQNQDNSKPKWTPGPWQAFESSERSPYPAGVFVEVGVAALKGASLGTICEMVAQGNNGKYDSAVTGANAHLIAAAPELYDALEAVSAGGSCWCEAGRDVQDFGHSAECQQATAALAKARGEHAPSAEGCSTKGRFMNSQPVVPENSNGTQARK